MRPRLNDRCFKDDMFKCTFLHENCCIPSKIYWKSIQLTLVQTIASCCRAGDKPLSHPMTHITRPRWVKFAHFDSFGIGYQTHELPNDPSTNQSSGIMYGIRASYQYKDSLSNYGIFIMKMIISSERLIFIMGIPRLVRRRLYIETVPWLIPNSTPWFPERHICSTILALGSSSSYQGAPSTVTYHGFTMSPCAQLPTNYLSIVHYFNEAVVALS